MSDQDAPSDTPLNPSNRRLIERFLRAIRVATGFWMAAAAVWLQISVLAFMVALATPNRIEGMMLTGGAVLLGSLGSYLAIMARRRRLWAIRAGLALTYLGIAGLIAAFLDELIRNPAGSWLLAVVILVLFLIIIQGHEVLRLAAEIIRQGGSLAIKVCPECGRVSSLQDAYCPRCHASRHTSVVKGGCLIAAGICCWFIALWSLWAFLSLLFIAPLVAGILALTIIFAPLGLGLIAWGTAVCFRDS